MQEEIGSQCLHTVIFGIRDNLRCQCTRHRELTIFDSGVPTLSCIGTPPSFCDVFVKGRQLFVTSCLLPCTCNLFKIGSTLYGKKLPLFLYDLTNIKNGEKCENGKASSSEIVSINVWIAY